MSILTQLRKMNNSIRYTKEDKQIFREKTLEMLRKGIGQNEIARKIGVSAQYISNLKNSLIKGNKVFFETLGIEYIIENEEVISKINYEKFERFVH